MKPPTAPLAIVPAAYIGRHGRDSGTGPMYPDLAPAAPGDQPPMDVADWDALYSAVETRLRHIVGEELGVQPEVPQHAASLSASLVQAVVLDCVSALDQLHAALQQERRQRQPLSRDLCEVCAGTGRQLAAPASMHSSLTPTGALHAALDTAHLPAGLLTLLEAPWQATTVAEPAASRSR